MVLYSNPYTAKKGREQELAPRLWLFLKHCAGLFLYCRKEISCWELLGTTNAAGSCWEPWALRCGWGEDQGGAAGASSEMRASLQKEKKFLCQMKPNGARLIKGLWPSFAIKLT